MFQDMDVEELLAKQDQHEIVPIDVRSPSEYREATIPGSLNIPIFTDEERAEIGTLYKQVSVEAAKSRGLEIVSAKLPDFIKAFQAIPGKKAVFCWRGGMRSRTTATLLGLMGIKAYRLNGGFRSYRRWVVEQLEQYTVQPPAYVLNGNTGNGKTYILQQLEKQHYPVLDLEAMAGHRGSVFGGVGLTSHNQKKFDSALLKRLLQLQDASCVLFEAESKRIGKIALPDFLLSKKDAAVHFWIELPMDQRVHQILMDYRPEEHQEECMRAFRRIKERIHTPIAAEIEKFLQTGQYAEAIPLLLKHYYDPRYEHTAQTLAESQLVRITAKDADEAAEQIRQYLSREGVIRQA
ncbi:tRNA 2-selenouridine(34) synthase MnmH [Paenibacillus sp. CAA11]|uniref:tRNA 2-selenouridine(34) synthase MnmH n=1 Tax=Paenibacillus sp. CAA11 TaxID=1532905 RepID=UPI000D3B307D|nr:tRNA 2-selenouridine(34) synthase MnmH [Paenibacillus sp. CAA11]AWB44001.1 tRNA 2-selenouridine(34) synthase MnmH [Paenibacillus sp. CAA11]